MICLCFLLETCQQILIYVSMSFICQPTDLCVVYDVQSWQSQQHEGVCFTTQDGLTGSAWGDWANYTASPLRAFENELGVQAPVGLLAFQQYLLHIYILIISYIVNVAYLCFGIICCEMLK